MTFALHNRRQSQLRGLAFTVVELLVAVSIMTLIVLALYSMFDQTQRALRGNVAQVDVLEGGRASSELMTRELEQMEASNLAGCTNLLVEVTWPPWGLPLVNTNVFRTNVLEEFFFVSRFNKFWSGIGYKVLTTNGVGTLYRFATSTHISQLRSNNLTFGWLTLANTNNPNLFQRMTDGVIHFRLTAFDAAGQPMTYRTNIYPNVTMTNAFFNGVPTGETGYIFLSNAVPAYVELEMAILEPHVLERFRSFPNPVMARNYLARQVGAVHLFRQRVPVRTAK